MEPRRSDPGKLVAMKKTILLFLLLLYGCATTQNKTVIPNDTVSFVKDAWVFSFSPNMPAHPTTSGTGWYFDFPSSDGVHYLLVPYRASKPHQTLTITYRVSGTGKFVGADTGCNRAPNFRPMLERNGDMMGATQEFYRWWSNPDFAPLVADGQVHTLTVPLVSARWSDVYGKFNATEFSASLKDLMAVGVTFGSGCTAGHGAWTTGGKARFELLNFQIL